MAERTAQSTPSARKAVINEAAARNASIELRSLGRDGRPITARARIVGVEDDRLLLDSPQSEGHPVVLRSGQSVAVRFRLNDAWYSFDTAVVDATRLVAINARMKVVGVAIRRPDHVQVARQRRSHFRVPFIGDDPVELELHDAQRDGGGCCPVDARRFGAMLTNLSVGGAGVRLKKEHAAAYSVGTLLFLTFTLPDDEEPYSFLVEVRQIWTMPDTGEHRMGVQIHEWPGRRAVERTQQRLERYLARIQRGRLQRRRK